MICGRVESESQKRGIPSHASKEEVLAVNVLSQWCDDNAPSIKIAIWGATIGAIALMITGSYWPGWNLESTTQKRIVEATADARTKALLPVCVESFQRHANAQQQAALLKADSWKRGSVLQPVVQIPGEPEPGYRLIDDCANAAFAALEKSAALKK